MLKFLARLWQRNSEKVIKDFLTVFETGDSEQNGMVVGRAALIHYSLASHDPEFSKLVNSQAGENQGPICTYILHLNKGGNDFHREGAFQNAAGVKLWNITFRCMSDNSFLHYGIDLWRIVAKSFPAAREYLENELELATKLGKTEVARKVRGALPLYNFVPPQFRSS